MAVAGAAVTTGGAGVIRVARRTGTVGVSVGTFGILVGVPVMIFILIGGEIGLGGLAGTTGEVALGRGVGGMRVGVLGAGLIGGLTSLG